MFGFYYGPPVDKQERPTCISVHARAHYQKQVMCHVNAGGPRCKPTYFTEAPEPFIILIHQQESDRSFQPLLFATSLRPWRYVPPRFDINLQIPNAALPKMTTAVKIKICWLPHNRKNWLFTVWTIGHFDFRCSKWDIIIGKSSINNWEQ